MPSVLNTTPTLEEVESIFDSQDAKRVPVCATLLSDWITPIQAMRRLRKASSHCFMLESAEADKSWGRYTFLGYKPTLEVTCANGLLRKRYDVEGFERTEEVQVDHPGDEIRQVLKAHKSAVVKGMPPFTGGLVGYFSYDYLKYAEPILKRDDLARDGFLDVDLMLFDSVIVFDNYRQKIILVTGVYRNGAPDADGEYLSTKASYAKAQSKIERLATLLREGDSFNFEPLQLKEELTPTFPKERYMEMVEAARHHIYEGDIFQVVLSNPQTAQADGSLFDAYRILRTQNPSPYMFYFTSNDVEIAGASPETLVRLQDGRLTTYPLAGTRPRGETPEIDAALEAGLMQDAKELSEHNMLVDLGRNDLGRIAELGSVEVASYMQVLKFSRVMHIGSTVEGNIAKDKDALDAIDSILPAGTLSGAPKIRACQIIQDQEGTARGIYGGAIGYLDFSGNLDTCISIRLAYKKNGTVCVQSGAGIVADSDPATEFMECTNKARAVVEALTQSQGGVA
jgi:anthranilate synthase component 1